MKYSYLLLGLLACAGNDTDNRDKETLASNLGSLSATSASRNSFDAHSCGVGRSSTLTGNGLGTIRIGAQVEILKTQCQIVSDTMEADEEGQPARVLTVQTALGPVTAEIENDLIWRITPTSKKVRTVDSLGIGSALADLLAKPGASGIEAEGALYITLLRHCGISFRLDYDIPERAHRADWSIQALRKIKDRVFVDQIFVTSCRVSSG